MALAVHAACGIAASGGPRTSCAPRGSEPAQDVGSISEGVLSLETSCLRTELSGYERFHDAPGRSAASDQVDLEKTVAHVELLQVLGASEASSERSAQEAGAVAESGDSGEEGNGALSAAERAAVAGALVIQALEDEFDMRGASTEYLRFSKHIEDKALAASSQSEGPGAVLEGLLRLRMLWCVWSWVQLMGFHSDMASWFDAAVRLDAYCARKRPRPSAEELPEVAMAIVKLLKKEENGTMSFAGSNLSVRVNELQSLLASGGLPRRQVSEEMLAAAEIDFLTTLGWQFNLPTPQRYIELFRTRVDTLTRKWLAPQLEWATKKACTHAWSLQMREAAGPKLSALMMAIGLFALCLLGARQLPARVLKPRLLDEQEWEQLVVESEIVGSEAPRCLNPPAQVLQLLRYLEFATDAKLAEIQDACHAVVGAARDMVLSFRAMQQQQQQQQQQPPAAATAGTCGGVEHNAL